MFRWVLLLVLVLMAPLRASAQTPIWDLPVAPSPRLGLAFPGSDPQFYGLMAQMGIGVVRVSAAWERVEPRPGQFNFRGLDARVRELGRLGIIPFLTFESNASWGADHTGQVKNGTPRDLATWTRFVTQVVARYDGDGRGDMPGLRQPVRYYQVANEFLSPTNRSGGWAGGNDALLAFVNATHDAVKAEDRRAQVVLGGIAAFNADIGLLALRGQRFQVVQRWSESSRTVFDRRNIGSAEVQSAINDRFLPVVQRGRYDVASVHLYGPEDRDGARIAMMRDLSRRPVISSECGGPSLDYGGRYSGQAHYGAVLRRNLNTWAAGSQFCLWFGLGESITSTFGNSRVQLYDRRGREKPGVQAYRLLARIAPVMRSVRPRGRDAYEIATSRGTIWMAFGRAGRQALGGVPAGAPAICINDAARRDALETTWGQSARNCDETGITLAGDALISLLRGR